MREHPMRWASLVEVLPVVAWLAAVAFLVERQGGFDANIWYPLALLALGAVVTVAIAADRVLFSASRRALLPVAILAGYTAWSYVTIAWSAVRGDALDGSNKGLLYLFAFALLACWPLRAVSLWPVVFACAILVTVEGVITVGQAIWTSTPTNFFIGGRLSAPLGYPSATAALFMVFACLMVGLASRRWLPVPARAAATGLAGLDGALSLLSESRGSVFTLPLVLVTFFALVPGRLRSLAIVALIGLTALPVVPAILHVYSTNDLQSALRHAAVLVGLWTGALCILGGIAASLDGRVHLGERAVRWLRLGSLAALALALATTLAVSQPWHRVGSAWHSFRHGSEPASLTHFGGLGSNRYDFWRVGIIEFKQHPITGIGTDNFLVPYLQLRRSSEAPAYPHSLAIRLLSQQGLVGAVLFAAFITAVLVATVRIPAGKNRELAGVLLAGASVWFWHGMVDWLWEMPVLGLLGMGLLGAACGLSPRERPAAVPTLRQRRALLLAAAAVSLAGVVALAFPWIADRQVRAAEQTWRNRPAAALAELDSAARLNPLSNQADVIAGAIASKLHRFDVMRERFARAARRTPDDWYAALELGIAASLTGRHEMANRELQRAHRLIPGNPVVERTLRDFAAGRRIDPDAVDREFAASG